MSPDNPQQKIEFLTLFFGWPKKSFYQAVYRGATPLGQLESEFDEDTFCEEMMTETTDLFINSQKEKIIYPLASKYIEDKIERKVLPIKLSDMYLSQDKVVSGYPPDHAKVLYEFLLYCLTSDQADLAVEFHADFIINWTNKLASAIIKRSPSLMFTRIAHLIEELNHEFAKVV